MAPTRNRQATRNTHGGAPRRPRFDGMERLLHRFYEPLILLKILEPTQGRQNPQVQTESTAEEFRDVWGNFLDCLSWLCDYKPGGKTVASVAAQGEPKGPVFWLAAHNSSEKYRDHISSGFWANLNDFITLQRVKPWNWNRASSTNPSALVKERLKTTVNNSTDSWNR